MSQADRILLNRWLVHCHNFPRYRYDNLAKQYSIQPDFRLHSQISPIFYLNGSTKAASLLGAVSCYVHALWRGLRGNRCEVPFLFSAVSRYWAIDCAES